MIFALNVVWKGQVNLIEEIAQRACYLSDLVGRVQRRRLSKIGMKHPIYGQA